MTIYSLGTPKAWWPPSIDAFENSADAAWRWNQEGGELKLKQVRRTPAAPRFEETFPGLRRLQSTGGVIPKAGSQVMSSSGAWEEALATAGFRGPAPA